MGWIFFLVLSIIINNAFYLYVCGFDIDYIRGDSVTKKAFLIMNTSHIVGILIILFVV